MPVFKTCKKCGIPKALETFRVKNPRTGNRDTTCDQCHNADRRERYKKNPEYYNKKSSLYYKSHTAEMKKWHRFTRIQKVYGISEDDFYKKLDEQNNQCAICKTSSPGKRGWHIDHCHYTGAVRGLLCAACNLGLGGFKDNPVSMRVAAEYIEKYKSQN